MALIHRPQEITREIDYAESLSAPGGDLSGMIDTTGVGVAGWSMGGEASLAVAGARWDLAQGAYNFGRFGRNATRALAFQS